MYTLKHNAIETTILQAIPAFPNDRNMLPHEVILLAAYDFCEQFARAVRAFQESNRDERLKPCMSQQKYTEQIYALLEARHDRPIYHDKNNVYQVLFAVSCLMGIPNHNRSWWEQTFAERTQEYLERTTLFQGSMERIRATIHKVSSLLQYKLEFDTTNPVRTAVQQTLQLFTEAEQMQIKQQEAAKPKRPRQSKRTELHIHLSGHIDRLTLGDNVQTKLYFGNE